MEGGQGKGVERKRGLRGEMRRGGGKGKRGGGKEKRRREKGS